MLAACYLSRDFLRKVDGATFYIKAVISSAVPFGAIWGLTTFVSNKDWTIIPYTIAGGLIFFACLLLSKILRREDKVFIYGALPASIRSKIPIRLAEG